jgi:hypothetical protein
VLIRRVRAYLVLLFGAASASSTGCLARASQTPQVFDSHARGPVRPLATAFALRGRELRPLQPANARRSVSRDEPQNQRAVRAVGRRLR